MSEDTPATVTRLRPPDGPRPATDLRARVRAEIERGGISHAQAAREAGRGVSASTLTRWLAGTYPGDEAAVAARLERWLDTRADAARRSPVAGLDRHAETGAAAEVGGALAYAQAAGDMVLVAGPSGRGKTWAARRYCDARSNAWLVRVTGACVSVAGLLSRVADTVGGGPRHDSAMVAEAAIVQRVADRGALLVIDEAHHLGARQLDELRALRDIAGAGVALIGDDSIRVVLARCPQVVGRIGIRVDLRRVLTADAAAIAETALGRALGAAERKRVRACANGPGGLHAVRRLLARAALIARAEGRDSPGADDIHAAAEEGAA